MLIKSHFDKHDGSLMWTDREVNVCVDFVAKLAHREDKNLCFDCCKFSTLHVLIFFQLLVEVTSYGASL